MMQCTIVEKGLLNEGPNYILGFCVIIYIIYQKNVPLKSNTVYAWESGNDKNPSFVWL